MKCLSVRQPWASLLVGGIKDVENRTWATNYRGKLLIHASSKKIDYGKDIDSLPYEWRNALNNGITTGAFPYPDELPYSAIIGYVTLVDCVEGYDSIWSQEGVNWVMKDAYVFDEPILGVKGKLNVYDVPEIDENHLPPAHKAVPYGIRLEGKELVVNIIPSEYKNFVLEQNGFVVYPTPDLEKELGVVEKDGKWLLNEIETVRFELPDGNKVHKVKEAFIADEIVETMDGPMTMIDYDLTGREFKSYTIQVVF